MIISSDSAYQVCLWSVHFGGSSGHFDDAQLNTAEWEHRGDKTYTMSDSRINWAANGSNWSHGEVDTVKVFPVPPAGRLTTIRWTLGKADVTVPGPGGNSLRPVLGICSAFETNTWTRQHWQNTLGFLPDHRL